MLRPGREDCQKLRPQLDCTGCTGDDRRMDGWLATRRGDLMRRPLVAGVPRSQDFALRFAAQYLFMRADWALRAALDMPLRPGGLRLGFG